MGRAKINMRQVQWDNSYDWRLRDIFIYTLWAGGVLMWEWLKAMFGRKCINCGNRKPFGTHYCDWCWKHGQGRAYGEEDD